MKYLVFIIYGIVIGEVVFSKPGKHSSVRRGSSYYKVSGILNMIVGLAGAWVFDNILRKQNFLSEQFVGLGMAGFGIMGLYGIYCVYRTIFVIDLK